MKDKSVFLENLFEFHDNILSEGRGMPARKVGETWKDKEGNEITFNGTVLLPKEGAYKDTETLSKAVQDYLSSNNITLIKEVNRPLLSAMVAIFTAKEDRKIAWVKYFKSMSNGGFYKWSEVEFTRDTGFSRGTGQAAMEKIPIQPSDLIVDNSYRPVKQVVAVALKNAAALVEAGSLPQEVYEHLKLVLTAAAGNKPSPVLKGGKRYAASLNKYLGEILAPISLVTGWLSTGDRESSEKSLLGKHKYSEMLIGYSQSKNEMLIDSNLVLLKSGSKKPEARVGVSSKAGAGASASVRTFADIVKKLQGTSEGNRLEKKYADMINVILLIAKKDWFEGPLEVARVLSVLSSKEIEMVKNSKNLNLAQFKKIKYSSDLMDIVREFKGLTPWDIKKPEPGYNPVFHVISAIAKRVVRIINEDPNFDVLIRELLNKSSMVQINSNMTASGDDCQFVSFFVKYPPTFSGKIIADASKNYSASRIRGPISFKIK